MPLSLYFIFIASFCFLYVALIYTIYGRWTDTPEVDSSKTARSTLFISVVVAARNEERNISNCVQSILSNHYPREFYELIVVNDHSDDKTSEILNAIDDNNLICLEQVESKQGKKASLDLAFANAKGEIIVTTDADCIVGENWIEGISNYFEENHVNFLAMPVCFKSGTNAIESFQVLDLCGMMGITNYGIQAQKFYLANGANLAFRKKVFREIGGFSGNEKYASGDDMFLIHKMAERDKQRVHFAKSKSLCVQSIPEKNLKDLTNQRKRWATKSRAYSDNSLKFILAFIFIFNLSLVINLFVGPFFGGSLFFIGLLQLFVKMIMDYLFLNNMTAYFDRKEDIKSFFPASILAVANILYSGFVGIFSTHYVWKGRRQQ